MSAVASDGSFCTGEPHAAHGTCPGVRGRGRPPVGRRFPMTLPDDLRAQLEEAAHDSGRSLSAEIVVRLAESFAPPRRARRNAAR